MIIFYDEEKKIDKRHTVNIINGYSIARAIQLNEDRTYESITYMTDDERTFNNEVIIDATPEELETYRKYRNEFKVGDKIKIVSGRKMKDEEKEVKDIFNYRFNGSYKRTDIKYLVFTDGTKVQAQHCIIL